MTLPGARRRRRRGGQRPALPAAGRPARGRRSSARRCSRPPGWARRSWPGSAPASGRRPTSWRGRGALRRALRARARATTPAHRRWRVAVERAKGWASSTPSARPAAGGPGGWGQAACTGSSAISSPMLDDGRRTAAGGDLGLGLGRVHVDVLLARQRHELVHDLVGDRAQDEAVVLHALVAGEVQRPADPDADPHDLREDLARRLDQVGVDHRHRDAPGRRPPAPSGPRRSCRGRAARPASGCPRGRCRAGSPSARTRRPVSSAAWLAEPPERSTGTWPMLLKKNARQPALDAPAGEVVGLGQEGDVPGHDERQEDRVGERQVVAREDRRTVVGHVLEPLDPGPEEQPEQRPDEHLLEQPVEQRHLPTQSPWSLDPPLAVPAVAAATTPASADHRYERAATAGNAPAPRGPSRRGRRRATMRLRAEGGPRPQTSGGTVPLIPGPSRSPTTAARSVRWCSTASPARPGRCGRGPRSSPPPA